MENHHTAVSAKTNPAVAGQNSTFKWLGICLGAVVLALIAISVFKVSMSNLFLVGALLACPLMHLWMMKDRGHKH